MNKKWIAITLLLLGIAALLGWRLNISMKRFNAENDLSKLQPLRDLKQRPAQEKPTPPPAPPAPRPPEEFLVIAEKNLFAESRTKEEKTETTAPGEAQPLIQKPILVGVGIIDNQKRASIIDPTSPMQGRNRRAQTKRVGDTYRGYIITDISPTHIVLESGPRREIIPLHEGSKRAQSGKTAILSTRVVPIGGGTSTGGTPVVVAGSSPAATARPAPTPAAPAGTTAPPQAGSLPVPVQQRPSPQQAPAAQQAQPQVPSTETDAQGRRIIRTPFGNIVRPPTRE